MSTLNSEEMRNQDCPVCSCNSFRPYKLGLIQCKECSLVLSPVIWEPNANEEMESEWFGEAYQPVTSFWVNLFEKWNNRKSLLRLSGLFAHEYKRKRKLLEVGIGSGSFMNSAREEGYDVMGCDLSLSICKMVESTHGIVVYNKPLNLIEGEDCFDVIVMNHVLEHVDQPIKLLQDVYRLLVPGGVAHIAVPNIACWEAMFSGWTSFEPYHLTYFSPRTLEKTVIDSGLLVEKIKTKDSFSGWMLAVLRTILGVNKNDGAVIRTTTSKRLSSSVRTGLTEHVYRIAMIFSGVVSWPLRILQGKLGRGDEVICIARKTSN